MRRHLASSPALLYCTSMVNADNTLFSVISCFFQRSRRFIGLEKVDNNIRVFLCKHGMLQETILHMTGFSYSINKP